MDLSVIWVSDMIKKRKTLLVKNIYGEYVLLRATYNAIILYISIILINIHSLLV